MTLTTIEPPTTEMAVGPPALELPPLDGVAGIERPTVAALASITPLGAVVARMRAIAPCPRKPPETSRAASPDTCGAAIEVPAKAA